MNALTSAGTLKWTFSGTTLSSADATPCAVGRDGTIYCQDTSSHLNAISSSGVLKWTSTAIGNTAVVASDGSIVFGGGTTSVLYPDGTARWSVSLTFVSPAASRIPAVGGDGTIYLQDSWTGKLWALH